MQTLLSKHPSCHCNVHDPGTDSSMFVWGPQSHGLLCHRAGKICAPRRYNRLFQDKSAPSVAGSDLQSVEGIERVKQLLDIMPGEGKS